MNTFLSFSMLLVLVGAFVAGWVAAKLAPRLGLRWPGNVRDPREDRIRSLEAELRVAHSSMERAESALEGKDQELAESQKTIDEYAETLNDQAAEIERLALDLRGSVKKTNELREELTSRAEENVRATVKLREVETELSVAHAGSELMPDEKLEYHADDEHGDGADGREIDKGNVVKFTI